MTKLNMQQNSVNINWIENGGGVSKVRLIHVHIGPTTGQFLVQSKKVIYFIVLADTIPCIFKNVIHFVSLAYRMAIM